MNNFKLVSTRFKHNEHIPQIYTCDGKDISPPLSWENTPKETKSFVLIMQDPDAPSNTWYHWILFNIPPYVEKIPEGVQQLPEGTRVGKNSWGKSSYGGPCPPDKEHRYFFNLYALDCLLYVDNGINHEIIEEAMEGHILGQTQLIGRYQR
jgi:Raf kinase inhibitor-like YbhB/YbcL family protein